MVRIGSTFISVITKCAIDQSECIENTQALPQRVKACSVSGSALLSCGEEPCPLRLQTVFSALSLIFPENTSYFCPSWKEECLRLYTQISSENVYKSRSDPLF